MNSFFDDSNKVKKLILLILICGIYAGLIIIGVIAICDHNDKKKQGNNIFNKITDDITDYYYSDNNSFIGILLERILLILKK